MKKSFSFLPAMLILAGVCVLTLLNSCKKDDDQPATKSFRLSSVTFSEEEDYFTTTISYNSDNKIAKISETENGVENYRSEWTWSNNEVTVKDSWLEDGGVWITSDNYQLIIYSGNHVAESRTFTEEDGITEVNTYTWNGDLLTQEAKNYYAADTLSFGYVIKYNYNGKLLTSADYYINEYLTQKQVIEYANGKPVSLKSYNYLNVLEEYSELVYNGDNIAKINYYAINEGVQGDVKCSEERTFDANNCVTQINTSCSGELGNTSHITYEEATGNLDDLFLTQGSWITVYLFPNSMPSQFVYKKKK